MPDRAAIAATMLRGAFRTVSCLCLVWLAGSALNATPVDGPTLLIEKTALPLDGLADEMITSPLLHITGAWQLHAEDARFGGISSMMMRDGALLLLSDAGTLFQLRGSPDATTNIADVSRLPGSCARADKAKAGDSESLAVTPDGLGLRIGLERSNLMCAFSAAAPGAATLVHVAAMAGWPRNQGAEAMASLPHKGMAIIGESRDGADDARPLLWYAGDPALADTKLTQMRYLPPKGFKPSDAVFLPDGRMLVLNRRYQLSAGRSSALAIVPAFAPREGDVVEGKTLARIASQPVAGNYEGMAIASHEGGTTIWLVSDDNFAHPGRTILLRLELDDALGRRTAAAD